jgi:hypothetical protein
LASFSETLENGVRQLTDFTWVHCSPGPVLAPDSTGPHLTVQSSPRTTTGKSGGGLPAIYCGPPLRAPSPWSFLENLIGRFPTIYLCLSSRNQPITRPATWSSKNSGLRSPSRLQWREVCERWRWRWRWRWYGSTSSAGMMKIKSWQRQRRKIGRRSKQGRISWRTSVKSDWQGSLSCGNLVD